MKNENVSIVWSKQLSTWGVEISGVGYLRLVRYFINRNYEGDNNGTEEMLVTLTPGGINPLPQPVLIYYQ